MRALTRLIEIVFSYVGVDVLGFALFFWFFVLFSFVFREGVYSIKAKGNKK